MAIVINSQWDAQQFYKQREEARQHINSQWDAQQFYETYGGHGYSGNWGSHEWVAKRRKSSMFVWNPEMASWIASAITKVGNTAWDLVLNNSIANDISFDLDMDSLGSISQAGVTNSSMDAATDSKTNAEKEYIEIEFNTLTGDVELIPTKKNAKITAGCTVRFNGVGKYLSGLYFVSEVKRTIDKDNGLTMTATLLKNGFGDSLKNKNNISEISPAQDGRAETVDISSNVVTSRIKVGDKVKIISDEAIYSNAHEGVKVPNWVKNQILTVDALSEDGERARLNPIWSWTYVKYLQLV